MINLRKVGLVCWREYLENVRTKAFLIGVIMTPVLMGLIFVAPLLFPDEDQRVVVIDGTGQLYPLLTASFEEQNKGKTRGRVLLLEDPDNILSPEAEDTEARLAAAEERLRKRVIEKGTAESEQLSAALIIEPRFLTDDVAVESGEAIRLLTLKVTDQKLPSQLRAILTVLRKPLRMAFQFQREVKRNPLAWATVPVAQESAKGGGALPPKRRIHVCDGTGGVLPTVQLLLGGSGELPPELRRAAAEKAGASEGAGGESAGLDALLEQAARAGLATWTLDSWRAPRIKGAQSPMRARLRQMGLDPDALPIDLPGEGDAANGVDPVSLDEARESFAERLRAGDLDAYLVVKREFLTRPLGPRDDDVVLVARDDIPRAELAQLIFALKPLLWSKLYEAEMSSANVVPNITSFNPEKNERYETRDVMAKVLVPFAFVFFLFYGVFAIAQALLNSVIEEKSNRIVEVLLSSLTPLELMLGKIIGTGLVGLTLVALWGGGAYATASYKLGADFIALYLRPELIVYFAIYYVLGFLFLASLVAAVGATCNTIKEAQNYMGVISILYVIPMMTVLPISQQPEGIMASVLSWIPPLTPFVMINRLAASKTIPLWEILATIAMLVVALAFAIWFAARVFRVGILMYGKPPSLRELGRWLWRG
ncbi:MAG: ABC transporter permease [Planctomycetota bacterium]|jgi:ABC-type Na+ efflux pump permease subunit